MNSVSASNLNLFLNNKDIDNRLYIKNGKLRYDNKIGRMSRFAAKLGFGNAAMSNISSFIKKNQLVCFDEATRLENFEKINNFLVQYNQNRSVFWKKAKKIRPKSSDIINIFKNIKTALTSIKTDGSAEGINLLHSHAKLLQYCKLSVSDESKQTFNEILELKNEVRAALLPLKGTKILKGKVLDRSSIVLSSTDQQKLKTSLKTIQTSLLTCYFKDRLEADRKQLVLIKKACKKYHNQLTETGFLNSQILIWEKKLKSGKPIAIPKWYHCTDKSNILNTILKTHILFAHKNTYGGAFVSNQPEITTYGKYCIVLSKEIDKTGTSNGKDIPQFSHVSSLDFVEYSDDVIPPHRTKPDFNPWLIPRIWAGFQRGKYTFNNTTRMGTEGIPLLKIERIQNGALEYYEDTSVAFIFTAEANSDLSQIGSQNRVKVITYDEAKALQMLIYLAYPLTLPTSWKTSLRRK